MRATEKIRLEKLLRNIETGFIPKELILSANIKQIDGQEINLTPDEYEQMMLNEATRVQYDPEFESQTCEIRMVLDLEKISAVLNFYRRKIFGNVK